MLFWRPFPANLFCDHCGLVGGVILRQFSEMPQLQLPIFPVGSVHLNSDLAVLCEADQITYFHGTLPVFRHRREDVKSFRMIISQLYVHGHVKQSDIVRVFGVSKISVKRAVKIYQQQGLGGFWQARKRRGAGVLLAEVRQRVQVALDEGLELSEVARRFALNYSTLNKAIHAGRLHQPIKKKTRPPPLQPSA